MRTVCIVDDDISFREALEGWVGSLGFATQSFGSAEAFLAVEIPPTIHCLVLDVQMPALSGLDLQAHLRATGHAIPIVFITSHSEPHHRTRALDAGAIGFLSKPFDRDVLMEIFKSIA
ncbi:response regulator [Phenylobacterium sp.]|uniref:response regulator transcription factor n=1 Tax=Phenylobacterium sp. TaxID=1871053 RepID=UPI0025F464A2|nr:response regulator [Phenylobacterium sp.]